jgi:hypothetical protein
MESRTALRRGHQLDEIGTPMPNGFLRQARAGQQDPARIDAARREQRYVIAQAAVSRVPQARDQPTLWATLTIRGTGLISFAARDFVAQDHSARRGAAPDQMLVGSADVGR